MSFFCAAHNTERISFLLYFFSSSMSLQAPCPPPSPRLHHPSYSKKSQEEIYDQYLRDGLQNYYLQQQKLQKTTKKLKHQTSDENAAAAEKLRKQKMSEKTNSSSNSSKVNRDQKSTATLMAAAASAGVHGLLYHLDSKHIWLCLKTLYSIDKNKLYWTSHFVQIKEC